MNAAENGAGGSGRGNAALRAAGVAAASGAAAIAARRALGRKSVSDSDSGSGSMGQAVSAGLEAAWNAARGIVMPTLEETAAAFGRYVADNAPETLRDSLVPRFVDGFHEAREQREGDDAEAARGEAKTTSGGKG